MFHIGDKKIIWFSLVVVQVHKAISNSLYWTHAGENAYRETHYYLYLWNKSMFSGTHRHHTSSARSRLLCQYRENGGHQQQPNFPAEPTTSNSTKQK